MKMSIKFGGFTLIELLIVIAIIGILAVAFLPTIMKAPAKGRDTARIADLQKIQKVLVEYNLQGNSYPPNPAASSCVDDVFGGVASVKAALGGEIPVDPTGASSWSMAVSGKICNKKYLYLNKPSGVDSPYSFGLYAKMETLEAGNIRCPAGVIVAGAPTENLIPPVQVTGSCYVILTK